MANSRSLGPLIDATGSRRRVQALVASGWPIARLATHLGRNRSNLWTSLAGDQIRASTAHAIRDLYDHLWRTNPAEHGVWPRDIDRARQHARSHGWATVGCWDEGAIDDPTAIPDWTGHCGTPRGYWAHYAHQLRPVCQPCKDARLNQVMQQTAA